MDVLLKSIGMLCTLGYVTGLLINLTPANHTQKAIRLVAVLYILSSVLYPLQSISLDFEYLDTENYDIKTDAQDYVIEQSAYKIKNIILQRLNEKNISYTDIIVHINKQNDGLQISGISLYGIAEKEQTANLLQDITTADKINFGD